MPDQLKEAMHVFNLRGEHRAEMLVRKQAQNLQNGVHLTLYANWHFCIRPILRLYNAHYADYMLDCGMLLHDDWMVFCNMREHQWKLDG